MKDTKYYRSLPQLQIYFIRYLGPTIVIGVTGSTSSNSGNINPSNETIAPTTQGILAKEAIYKYPIRPALPLAISENIRFIKV